ncbi:ribose-5-phosphate isomerase-like [Paramacrobiotus metropolitanus]|uniref:ribose-5-phosphate isomerase-like n=1 Tax=Paramacrobiotus metropolitanus TaxID=2943436 RepID=UPI0024464FC2|nr:ribose-5-phosphate isomerase-like [Paramacrobiotus metropolitanus]
MSLSEAANATKRVVAKYVMDKIIRPRTDIKIFGLGSGTTIELAMKDKEIGLGDYLKSHNIKVVPTSFQAYEAAVAAGLKDQIASVKDSPSIDLAIDGADEVDEHLNLIKGGGGCFLLEKTVALHAKQLIILADNSKKSQRLGEKWSKGIPVEIVVNSEKVVDCDFRHNAEEVKSAILKKFGGDNAKTVLRQASKKCGPVITDAGNLILDWIFPTDSSLDWKAVDEGIKAIPGVIATGVFVGIAHSVYFGQEDGSVVMRDKTGDHKLNA